LPHEDFGEAVTAFIIARDGAALTEKQIEEALQGRLARFKQPKRVLFLKALPRNTMGKVQKAVIREEYNDLYG
jgi:malonyl-CoA/methylmalonyl-CoA synthetase